MANASIQRPAPDVVQGYWDLLHHDSVTCALSDCMGRFGAMGADLHAMFDGIRVAGPAITARTLASDLAAVFIARDAQCGGDREAGVRDLFRDQRPSGRTFTPDEIARAVVWLCDPAAHNLTGAAIPIDRGWPAQRAGGSRRAAGRRRIAAGHGMHCTAADTPPVVSSTGRGTGSWPAAHGPLAPFGGCHAPVRCLEFVAHSTRSAGMPTSPWSPP